MKRLFDIFLSFFGLLFLLPVIMLFMFLIYIKDRHSPFYISERIGKNKTPFKMTKLRSMIINADQTGVDSTASDDPRITTVGQIVRKYKTIKNTKSYSL